MTNIYAHISDGDAPKTQQVTEVSFVDENGKHVDIGGGGTTEIHTDVTLAGTGTIGDALRLSDETNRKIGKAGTLTEDNLVDRRNVDASGVTLVGVYKNRYGRLNLMFVKNKGLSTEDVNDEDGGTVKALSVPAIPALAAISTLGSSAGLTDVINKVNEILNAVKNAN